MTSSSKRRPARGAAAEQTRPAEPGRSWLAHLPGISRRPDFAAGTGSCPVAAEDALGRRSQFMLRNGPEPGDVRCCYPDGFQNVWLLRNWPLCLQLGFRLFGSSTARPANACDRQSKPMLLLALSTCNSLPANEYYCGLRSILLWIEGGPVWSGPPQRKQPKAG